MWRRTRRPCPALGRFADRRSTSSALRDRLGHAALPASADWRQLRLLRRTAERPAARRARADYDSVLVIAKSAYEFSASCARSFASIARSPSKTTPPSAQVWGYGARSADRTGHRRSARSSSCDTPRDSSRSSSGCSTSISTTGRELDGQYVDKQRRSASSITDDPKPLPYRYRAVARTIDHEFVALA